MNIQDLLLERMKTRYQPMIESNLSSGCNTIWEYWIKTSSTYNHAWSASPLVALPKYIASIKPLTPGYETYEIKPDFTSFDTLNCTVPTINGNIVLSKARKQLKLNLPSAGAKVILTGISSATLDKTSGYETFAITDGVEIDFSQSGEYTIQY